MALPRTDPDAPAFARLAVNLADAQLGARALAASDEFFAPKERMLEPTAPVFVPDKYDDNGKWMDGWESRRRRGPGHDWCVVRLARPGRLVGADLDTCHYKGNYPARCSLRGAAIPGGTPDSLVTQAMFWPEILPQQPLGPDARHHFRGEIAAHAPL